MIISEAKWLQTKQTSASCHFTSLRKVLWAREQRRKKSVCKISLQSWLVKSFAILLVIIPFIYKSFMRVQSTSTGILEETKVRYIIVIEYEHLKPERFTTVHAYKKVYAYKKQDNTFALKSLIWQFASNNEFYIIHLSSTLFWSWSWIPLRYIFHYCFNSLPSCNTSIPIRTS